MATMRVAQVSRPGGPLELVERPIPDPGPGAVRIKVQACGVCHSDVFTKEGQWPGITFPRVPGHEVVGVIDAVGKDVPGRRQAGLGVQYAARMGFRSAAIARGKDKEPLARQLGAAHYIDSQAADPAAELAKLGGAKVVLATVTHGPAMSATVGGLAPRGRLMVLGAAESLETSPLLLLSGRRSIKGWYSGTSIDAQDTLAFSVQSGVRPM